MNIKASRTLQVIKKIYKFYSQLQQRMPQIDNNSIIWSTQSDDYDNNQELIKDASGL